MIRNSISNPKGMKSPTFSLGDLQLSNFSEMKLGSQLISIIECDHVKSFCFAMLDIKL